MLTNRDRVFQPMVYSTHPVMYVVSSHCGNPCKYVKIPRFRPHFLSACLHISIVPHRPIHPLTLVIALFYYYYFPSLGCGDPTGEKGGRYKEREG